MFDNLFLFILSPFFIYIIRHKIIFYPSPDKFKFTINRDSKWEIGENYKQVHNTEGEKQRVEHIAHFPGNGM